MTNLNTETAPPVATAAPTLASNVFLIQELAARHRAARQSAQSAVALEMKLRLKLVELLFPEPKPGTNKVLFPAQGNAAKAIVNGSIKIEDQDLIADIVDTIANNAGLLKAKYEMSESKYRGLPEEEKAKLKDLVTWKASAPQFEFEGELPEPKTRGCYVNAGVIWSTSLGRYMTLEEGSKLASELNIEYAELLSVLDSIQ